mgnify:CR=1 FL=1
MSESKSQTFSCPKCGAPQNYQGGSAPTIQCPYCETTLIVPEALRTPSPNFAAFNPLEITREAAKLAEIKKLADSGKKIEAIKLYRETFGVGLKEAKDAVEAIERGQNVQVAQISIGSPHSIRVGQGGDIQISRGSSGCVTWIVIFVVLITVLSIVVPILLSVGAFTMLAPSLDLQPTLQALTTVVPATRAPIPTNTAPPSPTPQFANVVATIGGKGTGAGKMSDARAVAVDNNGNLFVAEYIGGRVQVFDANGKFKTQCLIDPKAPTPSLAADRNGNLYVLQAITITKYNAATCEQLDVFPPALGESYEHIAVGADGNLYATMTGNQKDSIVRFNSSGRATIVVDSAISKQLGSFELDPRLALDGQGNFYILGSFARQVFKYDRAGKFVDSIGSSGSEPGQFSAVNALAVDSQGRIYVSDSKGVQVFTPDGRYIDVFDIPQNVASGMAFDDQDNLWIAAREQVYKLELGKK